MSSQINTANPDQLTYQNEILSITVLGGIKLEGLDRMRATLKVELNGLPSPDGGITRGMRPAVLHNIDLYNDTQLEKLIRKVAERHEVGTSVVAATLAELTEQLETYRLQKIQEEEANSAPKVKILNPDEIEAAQAFLSKPNLLERTNELIGQSGVIGEGVNRLLMYLIFTSRKLHNPLHIVSLGASGTGKTHLQEKVGDLIPQEDKLEITVLSENAFYYFGQRELKHKLILIEDLDGAENALYPLLELQTKKRISKTVAHKNSRGETKTVHLVVEGPLSVAGCTTREQIYEDNANRSFLIYLDESKEQDERIMNYQRAASAGRVNKEAERKAAKILSNAQRVLEPILVVNPFAELLKLQAEIFKPRRTNGHYLQFIEVVTFYNQYQREKKADEDTGEIYIETTLEDIAEANRLMKQVLIRKSDELTGACRNYLESIKAYLQNENKTKFTNREVRKALKVNESNQKRWTLSLLYNYYIKRVKGTKSKGYEYEITGYQEYKKLQEQIGNVLDETLESLRNAVEKETVGKRSSIVQKKNEPRKQKKVKAVAQ